MRITMTGPGPRRRYHRQILSQALLAALLGLAAQHAALAHDSDARGPGGIHAMQQRGEDPFAPVYIVTSRDIYLRHVADFGKAAKTLRDADDTEVILAEIESFRIADIAGRVHQQEKRCGGYFAFNTRAEAEAFVRDSASAKAAAPLAVYTIDNQATVSPWLGLVTEANIRSTITHLSTAYPNRYYASTHGANAARWIRDHWQGLANGRSDVSAELFTRCSNCATQPSVILTIQGNELPDEIVVLGGHLDSISSSGSGDAMNAPGADDDASGIATLTEVLRIALANGWKPQRTVKFMGYAAEEVGLRGSRAIAEEFRQQGKNVVGVLQLDMTNYTNGSSPAMQIMTDHANPALVQFFRDLFAAYLAPGGISLASRTCGYACSDHASWTATGFPAALVIERPFFGSIHSPNDTLANMGGTANHSRHFARLGLAFLGELAKTNGGGGGGPGTPQTYSNGTDYPITDFSTVDSPITVSGRSGNAPANTVISLNIVHTYRGELKVDLIAPDGSAYNLHNRTGGGTDNLSGSFTRDLSSEALNGTWKLRVNDNGRGDSGRIDSWSITF